MNTGSVVTSVSSSSFPAEQSPPVPTSVVRDELVRAVMPELRVLMQHLVDTAVERSVASLLAKQRELEAALNEVRTAQLRAEQSAHTSAKHAPEPAVPARVIQADARPLAMPVAPTASRAPVAPSPAIAVEHPAARTHVQASAAIDYDTTALEDIPSELNGSRRKKAVALMFAVALVALLLTAAGLSVLSNMGAHL